MIKNLMQAEFQINYQNSITFVGKGVHYNKPTTITVIPTKSDGIIFRRTDLNNKDFTASYTNIQHTQLNTTIKNGNDSISTIEHLMAAFYYMRIKNAIILIDGQEIPLMDGGSNDFIFGLETLDIPPQTIPKLFIKNEIKVELNDSYIIANPNSTFEVNFTIDFQNSPIGKQEKTFTQAKHNFKEKISHAKTFGHTKQIEEMNKNGICLGGDIFSATIFNDNEIISPSYTYSKMDFVRHKILDFIGDIHTSPYEIIGNFQCYKSSHILNNKLMHQIFSNPNNYTIQN